MNERLKKNFKVTNIETGHKKIWPVRIANAYLGGLASHKLENELNKEEDLLHLLEQAQGIVRVLANNYGVKSANITEEMVHLLPEEEYGKINDAEYSGAFCFAKGIFINEKYYKKWDDLSKLMTLIHELIHANSYLVMTRTEVKRKDFFIRTNRAGVKVNQSENLLFEGLNEAITVFLTNVCFVNGVKDKFEFASDDQKPAENVEIAAPGENFNHYKHFEKLFLDVCDKIAEKNPTKFEDERPIKDLFIEVNFKGKIERIAKLVMSLGGGALNHLAKITAGNDKENLERVSSFRKKYGLPEDVELNKYIENLKK